MVLNLTEKDIFGHLLERASNDMSNNSCNDCPVHVTAENQEEIKLLISEMAFDEGHKEHLLKYCQVGEAVYFTDWMLLDMFKKKILG